MRRKQNFEKQVRLFCVSFTFSYLLSFEVFVGQWRVGRSSFSSILRDRVLRDCVFLTQNTNAYHLFSIFILWPRHLRSSFSLFMCFSQVLTKAENTCLHASSWREGKGTRFSGYHISLAGSAYHRYRAFSETQDKTQSCFRAKTTTLCKTASKREREHYILKFKLLKFRFCDIENEIELETSRLHFPTCNHETDTEYGKTRTSKRVDCLTLATWSREQHYPSEIEINLTYPWY